MQNLLQNFKKDTKHGNKANNKKLDILQQQQQMPRNEQQDKGALHLDTPNTFGVKEVLPLRGALESNTVCQASKWNVLSASFLTKAVAQLRFEPWMAVRQLRVIRPLCRQNITTVLHYKQAQIFFALEYGLLRYVHLN